MEVVATTIDAAVTLTLLGVTAPRKDVRMDAVAKNALGAVHATAVQVLVNVQTGIPVHLANELHARMTVVVKVHATQRQVCATVPVDTPATIAAPAYAPKATIH